MEWRRCVVKATNASALLLMVLVAYAPRVGAQTPQSPGSRAFLNVDVGAQPQQRTVTTSQSFTLYDETATVTSTQPERNGTVFGARGGYRVRPNLAVAVGFSSFTARKGISSIVASVPDPVVVSRPRTITA